MKYHVGEDGNPKPCRASSKTCPIGGAHYGSAEEARSAYEAHTGSWSGTENYAPIRPAPLVPPTAWTRILERPDKYPAYLAEAFLATARTDPSHFVDYDEYYEDEYGSTLFRDQAQKVNLYAGHWIEAKVGVIDGEVNSWFMHGHCAALALELAPLKTNKIVAFETEKPQLTGERWSHAAALNDDGTCTDIEGLKNVDTVAASYGARPVTYDLSSPSDRTAFLVLTCSGKSKDEAFNDYYSPIEQAMIRHYAELVFHTY